MCCEQTFSDSGVVRGVVLSAHIQVSDRAPSEVRKCQFRPGQDLRGAGKLGSCPGPPQLRGLHKKTVKKYYLRKHKNTFWN